MVLQVFCKLTNESFVASKIFGDLCSSDILVDFRQADHSGCLVSYMVVMVGDATRYLQLFLMAFGFSSLMAVTYLRTLWHVPKFPCHTVTVNQPYGQAERQFFKNESNL
jgi:hypothetical protein